MNLSAFSRLFYSDNLEIVGNRKARWKVYLKAAANGRLLERPVVRRTWIPRKEYEEPMFGVLQSSYADLEYELGEMTGVTYRGDPTGTRIPELVMFCAGDGLALMRLNHLLAMKRDLYLDQTPIVIPIQGQLQLIN